MFIPVTLDEAHRFGWDGLDVVLVTGDAYIDSPLIGASVIGHVLIDAGYRVGIIPQPQSGDDIGRLGEPALFWGVTSGSVDSMVSNYNADRSRRRHDDFTPGERNTLRPDRALIAYTNLIRRHFKGTVPVVLGGMEASTRRIAHYDYWDNAIRRSVLFDAKADFLVYGMGERTILSLADALKRGDDPSHIPGLCLIAGNVPDGYHLLPSFEETKSDPEKFSEMFLLFCNASAGTRGMAQRHDDRYLIQNPRQEDPAPGDLDRIYLLPYERDVHPSHKKHGKVTALDTIQFSIVTHRGCLGECNFCSIAAHEGSRLVSRSESSIIEEARRMTSHGNFKGIINDVGGATANMYGMECGKECEGKRRCLTPRPCGNIDISHEKLLLLLRRLREVKGVRKVFVQSGIRYDLVMRDTAFGRNFLEELVAHHLSGQLRIAPEHTEERVLELMGKPDNRELNDFIDLFRELNRKHGKKQRLMFYLMAAHPGTTEASMEAMARDLPDDNGVVGQVQIFTPTPSTFSTLMYYTGKDPFTGKALFVERDMGRKVKQKKLLDRIGAKKEKADPR